MLKNRPIPVGKTYCNSSRHTCPHLQIPIGRFNGGFDLCRYFKVNIDRDEKQRPVRDDKCLEKCG